MSEVRLSAPVRATLADDLFDGAGRQPGAFRFWVYGNEPEGAPPAGLSFRCPCGCGSVFGIAWRRSDGKPGGWTWDGNRDAPTCDPSILGHGSDGPHWHGYLRAGLWVQA